MPNPPDEPGPSKPLRLSTKLEAKEKLARLGATHATFAEVAQIGRAHV